MMRSALTLCATAALSALALLAAAPCRAGMVQVTVRDTHGVPMEDVYVVILARPEDVARGSPRCGARRG